MFALLNAAGIKFGKVNPVKTGWSVPVLFPRTVEVVDGFEVAERKIRETDSGLMDFIEFMEIRQSETFRKSITWDYDANNEPQAYLHGQRVSPKELGWKSSGQDHMIPTHWRTIEYRAVRAIWATGGVKSVDLTDDGAKQIEAAAKAKAESRKTSKK